MRAPSIAAIIIALPLQILAGPVDMDSQAAPMGKVMIDTPDWTVTQLPELGKRDVDAADGIRDQLPCTFQAFFDTRCQQPRFRENNYAGYKCFRNPDCHSFRITGWCNATLINPHQDRENCLPGIKNHENVNEWSWLPTGYCYHVHTGKNWKSTGVMCRREGQYTDNNRWIIWNGPPGVQLPDMNRPDYQNQCFYSR